MATGNGFTEKFIAADGFDIRYLEAGDGPALIGLHGAGGLRISGAHEILARDHRVVLFEVPGFGNSPENTKSATMTDLAQTMLVAAAAVGGNQFHLAGNSFGGKLALWMAVQAPEMLETLILIAPAAIRYGAQPLVRPPENHEDRAALMYAHPERHPPIEEAPPDVARKQQALVSRLMGPPKDEELERRMTALEIPVLALFGTADRMIPPEIGRRYVELLANCHLMMIYDAAHAMDADRPEAVSEAVADFIARKEKFLVRETDDMVFP